MSYYCFVVNSILLECSLTQGQVHPSFFALRRPSKDLVHWEAEPHLAPTTLIMKVVKNLRYPTKMRRTSYRRRTFLSLTSLKSNAENAEYYTSYNMGHGYELNYYFLLYNVMMNVSLG